MAVWQNKETNKYFKCCSANIQYKWIVYFLHKFISI